MAADPEVVDLTEDTPERKPLGKRPRDAEDDAASRRAIMDHAKRVRSEQPLSNALLPDTGPTQHPQQDAGPSHEFSLSPEEETQARQRIMDFAQQVNASRGLGGSTGQSQSHGQPPAAPAEAGPPSAAQASLPAPAAISNSLLAQLHTERMARRQQLMAGEEAGGSVSEAGRPASQQGTAAAQQPDAAGRARSGSREDTHRQQQQEQQDVPASISLLTYNLWFREDVEVEARMQAVGRIIAEKGDPHFLCFQEVTPLIFQLLQQSPWWHKYAGGACPQNTPYFTMLLWRKDAVQVHKAAKIPFDNSAMGRDLKCVSASVGGLPVFVATTHLESPTGRNALYSKQRVAQCKQAAMLLEKLADGVDIVFAGDMNWNPEDGQPSDVLPGGWCDAWVNLKTGDPGLTYDPKANPMLNPNSRIRRRLDRAFCRLGRWRLAGMEMVGREALGLRHGGRPVLPSDHFGLLLQLAPA